MRSTRILRSRLLLGGCAASAALVCLPHAPDVCADLAVHGVDPSFGDGGFVQITPPNPFSPYLPSAAVDPAGRVLTIHVEYPATAPFIVRTHVRRFLADGTPDVSFGEGGQVKIDPEFTGQGVNSPYTRVAADALGRVIVVRGPDSDLRQRAERELSVRRFSETGAPDATFGGDGRVVIAAPDQLDTHGKAPFVIDADGNVLVAYTQLGPGTPARPTVRIVKFTSAGEIDATFGDGGFAMLPATYANWPGAMAIDGLGRIVVGGGIDYEHDVPTVHDTTDSRVLLARFLADGTPDPSFDSSAVHDVNAGAPEGEVARLSLDSQARIVIDVDPAILRFGANGGEAAVVAAHPQGGTAVDLSDRGLLSWRRIGDGGRFEQLDPATFEPAPVTIAVNREGSFAQFLEFIALPGGSVLAVGQVPHFSGILLVKFTEGGVAGGPDFQVSLGELNAGARALTGTVTITNTGTVTSRAGIQFLLSDDALRDASDDALKTLRVGRVAPGQSRTVRFRVPLSRRLAVSGRFVLAAVTARQGPAEAWRADNTSVAGPITR